MGEPIVRIVGAAVAEVAGATLERTGAAGGIAAGVRPLLDRAAITSSLGFRPATVDGWITSGKVVVQRVGDRELIPVTMHQPLATKAKALTSGHSLDPASFATLDQLAEATGVAASTIQRRIGKAGLATPFVDDTGAAAWERSVLADANVLAPGRSARVRATPAPGQPGGAAADAEAAAAKVATEPTTGARPDVTTRINSGLEHAGNGVRAFFGHRSVQRGLTAGAILATPSLAGAAMSHAIRSSGASEEQRRSMTSATELVLATAGVAMGMRGASAAHRIFGYTMAAGAAVPLGVPLALHLTHGASVTKAEG